MNQNWKRKVGAKVGRMSPEQAKAVLAVIAEEDRIAGYTIQHAAIRDLTGGYNSQTINTYVVRALATRAGYLRG